MNKLAEKVQQALVTAIGNDDLVLPTLPEVALNIRQAAEDPEISISHLSKVIARDT
ncbi:HDOD domain-containing protein, partial [Pseudomonas viridiflava]